MLDKLREANVQRLNQFPHHQNGEIWSPTDWACALAGEVGELCNLIKKIRRGESIDLEDVKNEIGDIVAYLDLLAWHLGIDLEEAIIDKFNIISERIDSNIKL